MLALCFKAHSVNIAGRKRSNNSKSNTKCFPTLPFLPFFESFQGTGMHWSLMHLISFRQLSNEYDIFLCFQGGSIERPECPTLEHLKLIRAEILCTGYVFRDAGIPGFIDVSIEAGRILLLQPVEKFSNKPADNFLPPLESVEQLLTPMSSSFIWVSYENPSSSYCSYCSSYLPYFWWVCRGNFILITLGSERVNCHQNGFIIILILVQVTYVIQADPKGWLPVWLINMFAGHQGMNVARIRDVAEVRTM